MREIPDPDTASWLVPRSVVFEVGSSPRRGRLATQGCVSVGRLILSLFCRTDSGFTNRKLLPSCNGGPGESRSPSRSWLQTRSSVSFEPGAPRADHSLPVTESVSGPSWAWTKKVGLLRQARGRCSVFRTVFDSILLLPVRGRFFLLTLTLARILTHGLDLMGLAAIGVLATVAAGGLTGEEDVAFLGIELGIDDGSTLVWLFGVVVMFFVAKSVLNTVLLRITTVFLAKTAASFSAELATYVFSGELVRLQGISKGDIQWSATTATQIAFQAVLFSGSMLVTESVFFLAILAGFVYVDVSSALVIASYFLILLVLFQVAINRRLRQIGERMRENSILTNNSVLNLAGAFRELSVAGKMGFFLEKFYLARRRLALDQALQRFVQGLPRPFVETALMVGIFTLVLWQFRFGNLADGLVVIAIFMAGGLRMMGALLPLQGAISDLKIQGPQARRAQRLIRQARAPRDSEPVPALDIEKQEDVESQAVAVTASGLTFSYPGSSVPALENVSFSVAPGEFVAIVGPSGSGKSTLADLTLGIQRPSGGLIEVDGVAPAVFRSRFPGRIGYVPQSPGMIAGSVAQNIAIGVPASEIEEERVWKALSAASLADFVMSLEDSLNSDLGHHLDSLSGGQLQRLGLARALYSRPRLLVLDEATSALDADSEAAVTQHLESIRGKVSLVVIAHRLTTVQNADNTVVLEKGRVIACGTFSSVRREVPFVDRYIRLTSFDS